MHGVFAVKALGKPFDLQVFTNPYMDGIVVRTQWSDVEPRPGEYNWSYIDSQLALAEQYGKQVHLMIVPGFWSPTWVLDSVPAIILTATYGHSRGYTGPLPIPWDQSYLDTWFKLVKMAGERYDSHPCLALVSAAGPTSVSAEMSLPSYPEALDAWLQAGYTPDLYFAAWQRTFAAFDAAFPCTPFVFIQHPGLPIPDKSSGRQMRQRVIEYGVSHFRRKFTLQSSGLSARKEDRGALGGWDLILEFSDRINVGFMMSTSATVKPEQMGSQESAKEALLRSVEYGVAANAQYLEIYEKDIVNLDLQDVLQYAQDQFNER